MTGPCGSRRGWAVPTWTSSSRDSTGAGDVFAAGLVHGLARGWPMRRVLETAVAWGSASVQYEGTVPPPGFPERGMRQPDGQSESGG